LTNQSNFGNHTGLLAAAIGLMAWMELSAMIVFLDAAWNAESATRLPWNFAVTPRTINE
jgi:uncharacterized BrkB/YihY/UPF0761 family membrane protein